MSRPDTARNLALEALSDRGGNVSAHLHRLLEERAVPRNEAALARELALGVVRRQATLDAIIDAFRQRSDLPVPARIRNTLRIGLYQMLLLSGVPDYAAVSESVNQVPPRLAYLRGFVNALLRNVGRAVSEVLPGRGPAAADVLPIDATSHRRFGRAVFPDPHEDRTGYLTAAYSLPAELAASWLGQFGPLAKTIPIAEHANARIAVTLRPNALRTTPGELLERLRGEGAAVELHVNGFNLVMAHGTDPAGTAAFAAGLYQPQDPTATGVVAGLDLQPGMRVLDLCAAPGTKTTHLAERMGNRGEIVACDVAAEKLARIAENCGRLGVTIVRTLLAEQVVELAPESFDLVLVDAPCSNTGVLARRPEARWRFSRAAVRRIADDQRNLLALGAGFVGSRGACVYATCSLQDEEDRQVVESVRNRLGRFALVKDRLTLPAGAASAIEWQDGGYIAILRR